MSARGRQEQTIVECSDECWKSFKYLLGLLSFPEFVSLSFLNGVISLKCGVLQQILSSRNYILVANHRSSSSSLHKSILDLISSVH